MRISDWSSDVCSSDLAAQDPRRRRGADEEGRWEVPDDRDLLRSGRASCSLKGTPFSPSAFRSGSSWPSSSRRSSPGSTWASPAPSRSEEHTSELQSLMCNSYAVFCLKKKISTVCPSRRTLLTPSWRPTAQRTSDRSSHNTTESTNTIKTQETLITFT